MVEYNQQLKMNITINPTKRQSQAWKYLNDDTTNIVLFGGSAGGGKSWLGCLWITTLCLQYNGIRCLIGRSVLTQLKLTTLNTLFVLFQKTPRMTIDLTLLLIFFRI